MSAADTAAESAAGGTTPARAVPAQAQRGQQRQSRRLRDDITLARHGSLGSTAVTREVLAFLSARPWLALDAVDIILATEFPRKDVVHAINTLQRSGRIASHLRGERVCYAAT